MSDIAIRVEGLSKRYRLGQREPYKALRDVLADGVLAPLRALRRLAGRGRTPGQPHTPDDWIWALKDVSFEVKAGEVLGVIGRNGAGKSTLLKVLSRITKPTAGRAEIHGRVGSLLEIGTGFHPELTGRENVYLNGAILGMKRAEIQRRFDEIVAFAEIEQFLDTPVKRYSSGMYMRLAFAVAAHLEPEILIVDEVLAVGDAQFQRKCLGKMGELAQGGRTVLFVSHNMTAISQLCPRSLILRGGRVVHSGESSEVIAEYLNSASEGGGEKTWPDPAHAPGNQRVRLSAVRLVSAGRVAAEVDIDKEIHIEIEFSNQIDGSRLFTNLLLLDSVGNIVLETGNTPGASLTAQRWFCQQHPAGLFRSTCTLPANFLNDQRYFITVMVASCNPPTVEAQALQVLSFNVFDTGAMRTPGFSGRWSGVVRVPLAWDSEWLGSVAAEAESTLVQSA